MSYGEYFRKIDSDVQEHPLNLNGYVVFESDLSMTFFTEPEFNKRFFKSPQELLIAISE